MRNLLWDYGMTKKSALAVCLVIVLAFLSALQVQAGTVQQRTSDVRLTVDNAALTQVSLERTGIRATATLNKRNRDIRITLFESVNGKWQQRQYEADILHALNGRLRATLHDVQTDRLIPLDSAQFKASFLVIPVIVMIGELLLAHLIALSLAVVITGITYIALSRVAESLRKQKPEHYAAYLDTKRGVFIGEPLSRTAAALRLRSTAHGVNNTWSKSIGLARDVAFLVHGKTPVGPEIHGPMPLYQYHFHPFNRSGGHAFY
jgi:hypothetical protein